MIEITFTTPWAQWLFWLLTILLLASQVFLLYARGRKLYWESKLTEDDVQLVARVRAAVKEAEDKQ